MLNYIKAEVYRNFNRAYFWVFTIALTLIPLIFNTILKIENSENFVKNSGLTAYIYGVIFMISVPVFFIPIFLDMTIAEEYKNLTLRNVVTFGMNRTKIVISKFIVSTVLAVTSAAIILTILLGSATILFGLGQDFPGDIKLHIMKFLVAIVLWIGAMAVGTLLTLIVKNNNIFAVIYVMIFGAFNLVLKALMFFGFKNFKYLYDVLITTQLSIIKQETATSNDLKIAALIGVVYIVVFLGLSAVWFNKQEVK